MVATSNQNGEESGLREREEGEFEREVGVKLSLISKVSIPK
jgi:hypothetical protein